MIQGQFDGASPTVSATFSLKRIGRGLPVETNFLLDTGANFSIIHPADLRRYLGEPDDPSQPLDVRVGRLVRLVQDLLRGRRSGQGLGIGGRASYYEVDVTISFDEGGAFVTYGHTAMIALPTASNWDLPSMLGMDFLTYFDVHLNHPRNVVELEFIR